MQTRTVSIEVRIPVITDPVRSSIMASCGTAVIGAICGLVARRALVEDGIYRSRGAAGIGAIAAISVFLCLLRWVPSLSEEPTRSVPRRAALLLLAASAALGVLALIDIGWDSTIIGVLSTLALVNVYLGCWGYRSLFLMRRMLVFSVISWPPMASGVYVAVHHLLGDASDLVYQRLASFGVGGAGDHPWRVLSAMSNHAAVAVTGAVVLTLAASRLRLSIAAASRLLVAAGAAMVLHHIALLSAPIESYSPSWWGRFAAGPLFELCVAGDVAASVFYSAWRLTEHEITAPASVTSGRDPEIFGADNRLGPAPSMRFCSVLVPAFLLTAAVVRR